MRRVGEVGGADEGDEGLGGGARRGAGPLLARGAAKLDDGYVAAGGAIAGRPLLRRVSRGCLLACRERGRQAGSARSVG